MTIFRRKRLPPSSRRRTRRSSACSRKIEPAKEALTEVMPTTRLPGRPCPTRWPSSPSASSALGRRCRPGDARRSEREWLACAAGIDEALGRARRFREEAPDLGGFEGLIWAVEELLGPLEPFEAAAERFRSLRVAAR